MSPDNPPTGPPFDAASTALAPMTPLMIDHLRRTKPWVRFLSIVGFVGAALISMLALVMPFIAASSNEFGGWVGGVAIAIAYLLCGVLYFIPAMLLFRYADAIRSLLATGNSASMEQALASQRSFWTFAGIATLVVICLYAVLLVLVLVVGIGAALTGFGS